MPPWEKYGAPAATSAPPVGPWAKYGGDAPAAAADNLDQLAQQLAAADAPPMPGLPVPDLPQRAEPQTETDSPWSRYISDVAASIPDGLRQGVAAIAAAPVEIVNMAPMIGNILPGEQGIGPMSERPVGGYKDIDEALRLGSTRSEATTPIVPDYKPETVAGRFANRVSEEVGATAVPLLAAGGAAARLGKEGARQLPGWQRRFVEPMAVDPGRVAAREGAYAVAAGTGAQTANEIVSPDGEGTWWSDLLGSVGGVAGLGAVNAGADLAGYAYGAARGSTGVFDDVAGEAVASRLIDNSTVMQEAYAQGGRGAVDAEALARRLETPSAAEVAFPGFRANIADRAQDPGLATLAYNSNTILPGAMNARINANAAVVDDWFKSVAPEGNAPYLRQALQQGAEQRIAAAVDEASGATRAFDDALSDLRPQRGPVDRGYAIRNALQRRNDAELARIADMYGSLDGSLPVDYTGLRQQFDDVTAGLPLNDRTRFAPAETGTVRQLAPDPAEPTVLPLNEALSIRSGLAAELTESTNPQQRRVAGQYQDATDEFIRSALPEDQVKLMDEARAARLDVGRRFEDTGAVPEILNRTGRTQYTMPNEAVPGRVLQGPTDYQAVMREAGSDAAARRAVAEQIKDEALQANAIRNPDALARFMQERNFALKDFPEVRNALERAGASKQTMEAAEKAAAETTKRLSPGGPSATGQYLRYDDTGTRQAIKTAWNSDQPERAVRELLEVAGDTPDARAAAKAALWEEVAGTGRDSARTMTGEDGVTRWNGRKLHELMQNPKFARTAEILWEDNPEHLANIRQAADALAGAEGAFRAKAPGASGTAQALVSGKYDPSLTTTSIASRVRSVNRGQLSPTIAIIDVASTALRNRSARVQSRAIEEMMARAINEPEFAAALLRQHNPADAAAMKRAFLSQYGVRLPTVANILAETDDDEDETFDRVMGAQ